ncbi:response regulator [Sphingomonas sp. BK235]|uniref:response regulator n=1 Tax=Sphingomonas sp. BK235 TaxID=2512131 RepID=UPI00104F9D6A|nr:response regulator [Sphingomonas sp. BK235]TCP29661.1 two-component system chemotaxis response regulator CheY [Sphingomonas sp. BK235]
MADTILIVDDSPSMLMSIEIMLGATALTVHKAESGEQALALLGDGLRPAMILTDLNMGALNGVDLVRAARQLPGLGFTPIVLLTTESAQDMRDLAKSAGATGWLTKPVESEALLRIVRKLVPSA